VGSGHGVDGHRGQGAAGGPCRAHRRGTWTNHFPRRPRKLLLHKREIVRIEAKTQEPGLTLVPLALYFKDGKAKIEIALARGKRAYDKRQAIARREAKREMDRVVRHRTR
jgi:SsrA-binding protein